MTNDKIQMASVMANGKSSMAILSFDIDHLSFNLPFALCHLQLGPHEDL